MERFSNDASRDRDLDLLRRLRCWLRRACVAIAQAQAHAPTLRTLQFLHVPAGHTARILKIYNHKEIGLSRMLCCIWSRHDRGNHVRLG